MNYQRTYKTILAIFGLVLFLVSCEDVIEVELDSIPPRMVIEGSINDLDTQVRIKLSTTSDYFKPGENPAVSDAFVAITDEHGNTTAFEETAPGIFISNSFLGIANTTYTLEVQTAEEFYQAVSKFPEKVYIDSLSFEPAPLYMDFEENAYQVSCYLKDPHEIENYYRIKAYVKGDESSGEQSKVVFNDDFVDGNLITVPWDLEGFFPLDTVVVELQTLDLATYDYYRTLFPILEGGLGSPNPTNPETNLSNDALGFFGAFTINRDTIVIQAN